LAIPYLRSPRRNVGKHYSLCSVPEPWPLFVCLAWVEATFVCPNAARYYLTIDRPRFVLREDIMGLIPTETNMHIMYPTADGNIDGFRELFVYLATSPPEVVNTLRQLIVAYFESIPTLRGHLRQDNVNPPPYPSKQGALGEA